MHDFAQSLAESKEKEGWFEPIYRQIFPSLISVHYVQNIEWQKKGIDVRLNFLGGWSGVEEKLRKKWMGDDLALEYLSSAEHDTPGWIEKNQIAHYLAYGWEDTGKVLFIDYQALRENWEVNKTDWLNRHFISEAKNNGYTTKCCCVPFKECLHGIKHSWWRRK